MYESYIFIEMMIQNRFWFYPIAVCFFTWTRD